MSVNKIILIGRIGNEPETKHFDNGQVTNASLATSEKYTNKSGEKVEETEWHNIVFRGKLSEIAEKYIKKGDLIFIEGKLKTRKWEDKDGNIRYITESIVSELKMLGSSNKSESAPQVEHATQNEPDDLPF